MYDTSHQPEAMQARYKYLPPAIKELFEYGTVELTVDEASQQFSLNGEQKDALLMEIELVLYFFLTRKGFVERVKDSLETDQTKATQIAAKVEGDLFLIVDSVLDIAEAQFELGQEAIENTEPAILEESQVAAEVEPSNPEIPVMTGPTSATNLADVKPMRTFPEDINTNQAHSYGAFRPQNDDDDPDEPVHRSSQDDIIKK